MRVLHDDRGQSEILGYAIIFGIILLSVTLLYATGAASLSGLEETAKADNAEAGMGVFRANIDDIATEGAPSRATELKLADSQLGGEPVTNVTVIVKPSSSSSTWRNHTFQSNGMAYRTEDEKVIYTYGAVMRTNRNGDSGIIVSDPPFRFESGNVSLRMIEMLGDPEVGGQQNVLITADSERRSFVDRETGLEGVTVHVNASSTAKASAWETYFEEQPGTVTRTGNNVRYDQTGGIGRLYISRVVVSTDIES